MTAQAIQIRQAKFVHHFTQPARANRIAIDQRVNVSLRINGCPGIGLEHRHQRLVETSLVKQTKKGHIETLHEYVSSVWHLAKPPDIHQVTGAGKQGHQLALVKRRRHHHQVVKVACTHPGIVGTEHIPVFHRIDRESLEKVPHRFGHGVDMPGGSRHGLRQHSALGVKHASRQIARLAHDRAESCSNQGLGLLFDNREQPIPHDLAVNVLQPTLFAYRIHFWPLKHRGVQEQCSDDD